jgi:putative lipoic acid-binding regulatory protein
MDQQWADSFREKLNQHYRWPALYMFKFIIPTGQEPDVRNLFPHHPVTEKTSAKGKYTSVTFELMMDSAESVIAVYQRASSIEGLIAL